MPKKTFEGEGNPSTTVDEDYFLPKRSTIAMTRIQSTKADWQVEISEEERLVLKVVLDRDRTGQIVHGGLKSLLQLSDDQAATLLGFLDRL